MQEKSSLRYEPRARLNNICPYFTMFPLDFPYSKLLKARFGDIVLDPFCGRGTTLYAARMLGLVAHGIDSNPVASAISRAKIVQTTTEAVLQELANILESNISFDIPKGRFWELAYHEKTLEQICKVRQALLERCDTSERIVLRAVLLGALHGPLPKNLKNAGYLSNQMPRTYSSKPRYSVNYWEKNNYHPCEIPVTEIVKRRVERYLKNAPSCPEGGTVRQGDARDFSSYKGINNVKWIITSPPYYGLNTYITDQWLRYWFVGGPDWPHYEGNKQIEQGSPEEFALALSKVWDNCAKVCASGAVMYIRFGGVPYRKADPMEILKLSFKVTKAPWKIKKIENAGSAESGYRQAIQMGRKDNKARNEFDVELRLE